MHSQPPPPSHSPGKRSRQIKLWADLLNDLDQGQPSISTSASEMALDVPSNLRQAVNTELERRGSHFRIAS